MQMLNFQFYEKVKVLYGVGAVGQLGELAKHIGGTKALIVSDPGMKATGVIEKIEAGLANENIPYVLFEENEPNPPIAACEKAFDVLTAEKCDFIIGVGGGIEHGLRERRQHSQIQRSPSDSVRKRGEAFRCGARSDHDSYDCGNRFRDV